MPAVHFSRIALQFTYYFGKHWTGSEVAVSVSFDSRMRCEAVKMICGEHFVHFTFWNPRKWAYISSSIVIAVALLLCSEFAVCPRSLWQKGERSVRSYTLLQCTRVKCGPAVLMCISPQLICCCIVLWRWWVRVNTRGRYWNGLTKSLPHSPGSTQSPVVRSCCTTADNRPACSRQSSGPG